MTVLLTQNRHPMEASVEATDMDHSMSLDNDAYFENVVASLIAGVILINRQGQVTYCNGKFEELLKTNRNELIDRPYSTVFNQIASISNQGQKLYGELNTALASLEKSPRLLVTTPQPNVSHYEVQFFEVTDELSKLIGWGLLVRDVTRERNEIVQQSEQLSIVSRVLLAPLATIKGYASTLLSNHRYWGENEREGFLESINESIDALTHHLENIREISRFETANVTLDKRPTDVRRLVERVSQTLTFQMTGRGIDFNIKDNLPMVNLDTLRIERVLRNILDNAIRYSQQGKRIVVSAEVMGEELHIGVEDQGMGIPKEHLPRIFECFYRVGYGPAETTKGAGLGLYVARGLVIAHAGRIWAESTPGIGTKVTFTLPVEGAVLTEAPRLPTPATVPVVAPAPTAPPPVTIITTPAAQPISVPKPKPIQQQITDPDSATVLVIEDDHSMKTLLETMLRTVGYKVLYALSGSIGLQLAATENPDIILLDISLPDVNGFDVCARIREFSSVPVVMITGHKSDKDVVKGLDVGADDYLIKPVNKAELLARVRANLRRSRVPIEAATTEPSLKVGDLMIDFAQRKVTMRGKNIKLTPIEYKLLYNLAVNTGRVLTHEQLLDKVWGVGYEGERQHLWVNISRLRRKLERNPSKPEYIATEPGVGYYLPSPDQLES
ncbi:MAG: response regulator [Chloroflexi bacterium]|nr:response regulator [Chloroflexota bacterium]NOG62023.1 response regulator [Chloroflexota bacterium]